MLKILGQLDAVNPINWACPLNDGLVSRWEVAPYGHPKFFGGNLLFDLCKRNDGALTNGPTWQGALGRPGGFGSLLFNGTSQYVSVPNASSINVGTGSFTVGQWVKSTTTATSFSLCKNDAGGNPGYEFLWLSGTVTLRLAGSNSPGFAANDGEWHYLMGVADTTANLLYLYADGESAGAAVDITGLGSLDNSIPLNIGARGMVGAADAFWAGSCSAAQLWVGRAFSASNAAAIYEESLRGNPQTLNIKSRISWFLNVAGGTDTGSGEASFEFSASGAGLADATGSGSTSFSFTAAGVGIADGVGNGSSEFSFTAVGAGLADAIGSGSSSCTFTAAGTGLADATGSGAAEFAFDVSGVSTEASSGSASFSFTAAGAGLADAVGAGTSSCSFTATAVSAAEAVSNGTASFSFTVSGSSPVVPPPPPDRHAAQGGGFPTGNLIDLVLGKNLKRGKLYKHETKIVYSLQISTKITILGGVKEKPRIIRRRRIERQVVCPLPIEVLMEIDEDLAICEMARRSIGNASI